MNNLSIEDAQAILGAGDGFEQILSFCIENNIDPRWASLFSLIDHSYMEVQLWADGDFGDPFFESDFEFSEEEFQGFEDPINDAPNRPE